MANKKEVKQHISSVSDIRMITNAMYLIASTKLRRAKIDLENARYSFTALEAIITRMAADDRTNEYRFFHPTAEQKPGIVVITADKGLAGPYNYNVIRKVLSMPCIQNAKLFVVGNYGRQYFKKHEANMAQNFVFSAEGHALRTARAICRILMEEFIADELTEIHVVYTDYSGGMTSEVKTKKLLPFERGAQKERYEFFPSIQEVLDGIVPEYLTDFLQGALTDSYCSEQHARMTAMDAANRNAEKLLDELSVKYDRIRQNTITQEIIEVSAGAKRQRQKGV